MRGKIRITDRSGASAEIDLSKAQTLDDVLDAINGNQAVNVTVTTEGDHLRLVDNTGQTAANLRVQDVGRQTTATSLGLEGIDIAAATADGRDLVRLTESTPLAALNDGIGIAPSTVLADVSFQLRDGTTGELDFSPIVSGTSQVDKEITLGDVLEVINAANPGKLRAEIGPDGKRLVVTDLTQGTGTFSLAPLYGSTVLEDLGLDRTASEGTITGGRLLGGMQSVLVSSLNGGKGPGALGAIQITDRSGATATVDLAGAETLEEVIDRIDAAGIGVTARVNQARNGLVLADTSGGAGNLVVANGDATATADKLNLDVNAAVGSVNSGDLHLQIVGMNTALSRLNGGAGVSKGKIAFYDSQGRQGRIDLAADGMDTVGDVIRAVNRLGLSVSARLNDTGDGILLEDAAEGGKPIHVVDEGATSAADLHLLGAPVTRSGETGSVQVIDGTMTHTVTLDADDTLADLTRKINELRGGATASTFVDGSDNPYRLLLSSSAVGKAGELVVDGSELGFDFEEITRAQDALVALGVPSTDGTGVLISSSSNVFTDLVDGVKLELMQATGSPVVISIDQNDADVAANAKTFVDSYNKFRKKLADHTAYDPLTQKGSVLTGDAAALRLDTELSRLLSGRFYGAGSIGALGELGINLKDDGTLEYDEARFKSKLSSDRQGIEDFFSKAMAGFSGRFKTLTDQLTGDGYSLLTERSKSLERKIDQNDKRIEFLEARLKVQEERLYLNFYHMETAISKLKSNLNVLDQIKPLELSTSSNG